MNQTLFRKIYRQCRYAIRLIPYQNNYIPHINITTIIILSGFLVVAGCSSNNGNGDNLKISGTIIAPNNAAIDSDVNDTNAPYSSNDDSAHAQILATPVSLGGYVNTPGNGPDGRSKETGDEKDYYKAVLAAQQTISLVIADDPGINNLDLTLLDGSGNIVAQSWGTNTATETIVIPHSGAFFIVVDAQSGASNYTLNIGQGALSVNEQPLQLSDEFVPGEVIAHFKNISASQYKSDTLLSRVKKLGLLPKNSGINRNRLLRLSDLSIGGNQKALNLLGVNMDVAEKMRKILPAGTKPAPSTQNKLETILAVQALRQRNDVAAADPNYIRHPLLSANDEWFSYQWNFAQINLPSAWDITTGSDSVIVAVIDTGVLVNHPDLKDRLTQGYDFILDPDSARDGDGIDNNPDDPGDLLINGHSSFHGTHVAGIIGATTNNTTGVSGITWATKIMPLRALGSKGGASYDIQQALYYAAGLDNDSNTKPAQRADVINLSLGGSGFSQTEQNVYSQVRNAGVIVVAAAGNSSDNTPIYPAAYPEVVSVSAVDLNKNLAPYSSFGPTIDVAAPGGDMQVDINGDGYSDGILSTSGDDSNGSIGYVYKFENGTSMAAPHVTGVIALMKAIKPDLTPQSFTGYLASGDLTQDLGPAGRDDDYGYGLIDAYKAIVAAGGQPTGTPGIVAYPNGLNFSNDISKLNFYISKIGSGTVTADVATENSGGWLTLASTLDANNLGSYTATVDRTGLQTGSYTAEIKITSNANEISLPVSLRVSNSSSVGGNAGFHWIILVNSDTNETIKTTKASNVNGAYKFTFDKVPAGNYLVFAGTDSDNDGFICDPGEACGSYTTLNQPTIITVDKDDVSGINFITGFSLNLGLATTSKHVVPNQGFLRYDKNVK